MILDLIKSISKKAIKFNIIILFLTVSSYLFAFEGTIFDSYY